MLDIFKRSPSLTPDALERLTVIRQAHFSVFPGHPVMSGFLKTVLMNRRFFLTADYLNLSLE